MTVEIALLHRVRPADRTPEELDAFLADRADWERPEPGRLLDAASGGSRVMVTADGGDAGFPEHTLPLIERHGVHCVLFVVSDWAKGVREPFETALWRALSCRASVEVPLQGTVALETDTARRRAFDVLCRIYRPLPTAEREALVAALGADPCEPEPGAFLSPEQLRALAAHPLVTIGVQSRTHAFLPRLRPERLAAEVAGSKREVEQWLGERIEWFAYPYGAYHGAVRRCVEAAGFRFACAVDPGGFEPSAVDRLALPRTDLALAGARTTGLAG